MTRGSTKLVIVRVSIPVRTGDACYGDIELTTAGD